MKYPLISVIMPVFNSEKYLASAIESILSQTIKDFEFIIIIECGTNDETIEIVNYYKCIDSRIRLIQNNQRLGIAESLNEGIRLSRGIYIARMDADDISLPKRFEEQINFLECNPTISICGTWVELFGDETGFVRHRTEPEWIKTCMIMCSEIRHPTVMMRAADMRNHDFCYDPNYDVEDFELFSRAVNDIKIANIPQVLLKYRIYNESSSSLKKDAFFTSVRNIAVRNLSKIEIDVSLEERPFLDTFQSFLKTANDVSVTRNLIERILQANQKLGVYEQTILKYVLKRHFVSLFNPMIKADFTNEIQDIITQNAFELSKHSEIVLFGLGKTFRDLSDYFIKRLKERIVCSSDNNSSKWGKRFNNLICKSPDSLSRTTGIIVLAQYDNIEEIILGLKEKGFTSVKPYVEY